MLAIKMAIQKKYVKPLRNDNSRKNIISMGNLGLETRALS